MNRTPATNTNSVRRNKPAPVRQAPKASAPRPQPDGQGSSPANDAALRKLTISVMDQLKMPTAIPSVVILSALKEAQALVRGK